MLVMLYAIFKYAIGINLIIIEGETHGGDYYADNDMCAKALHA